MLDSLVTVLFTLFARGYRCALEHVWNYLSWKFREFVESSKFWEILRNTDFYVQYVPAISSGNMAGVSAYRLKYYDSNETKIEEIFEKF